MRPIGPGSPAATSSRSSRSTSAPDADSRSARRTSARPWDSTEFRTAAAEYWPAAGIEPTPRAIELAGLGWWAAEVHGTLRRAPARATDERWLAANVQPVLAALDV